MRWTADTFKNVSRASKALTLSISWILYLIPFVFWYITFTIIIPLLPARTKPIVLTAEFWHVDNFLFGNASEWWKGKYNVFLDFLAAVVYSIQGILPIIAFLVMVRCQRGSELPKFVVVLGLVSFFSILTNILVPVAPPWYIDVYCEKIKHINISDYRDIPVKIDNLCFEATYNVSGNAAGLKRTDYYLGFDIFNSVYKTNKNVCGSFPSLHVGWPCVLLVFSSHRWELLLGIIHVSLASWAAVYLRHHYVLDIVGAIVYTFVVFAIVTGIEHATLSTSKKKTMFEFHTL